MVRLTLWALPRATVDEPRMSFKETNQTNFATPFDLDENELWLKDFDDCLKESTPNFI